MTHPSKRKGNTFEREIVKRAQTHDLRAERAYASNGRSLGHHETVDVLIENFKIQAKRRARIANWLKPDEHVDAVVVREDRGEPLIVLPLDDFLELLKLAQAGAAFHATHFNSTFVTREDAG
jgi:Holliday junction resolvase